MWLGEMLAPLEKIPPFAISILLSMLVATFTECSSNTATTTLFLPILGSMVSRTQHVGVSRSGNTRGFSPYLTVLCSRLPGPGYPDPPSVRDAALHHRRVSGLHAARGHTAQRHRLLVRKPQSHRYGTSIK